VSGWLVGVVLLSAWIHATWNAAAKRVAGHLPTLWLGLAVAGTTAYLATGAWTATASFSRRDWSFILAAAAFQAVYFIVLGRAYRLVDLSFTYPISRGLNVLGASILGASVLGERISGFGWMAIGLIVAGTLTMSGTLRRSTPLWPSIALTMAVAAILVVGTFVDKLAMATIQPIPYQIHVFVLSSLLLLPWVWWRQRDGLRLTLRCHKRWTLVMGFGPLVGYALILWVFHQGAPLGYVVALREVSVAIGAAYGFLFFGEAPTRRRLLGIAGILAGLALAAGAH